jgi:poly(3-hydroxybutyrate) depolymerase
MRLAGTYAFAWNASDAGGPVSWTLDREVSSGGGGSPSRESGVSQAQGSTATFNLTTVAGRETVYIVRAQDQGLTDELRIQVFPPDVRSSFTYRPRGAPAVRTYVIVPSSWTDETHLQVIMHGTGRNADEYCDDWIAWALRADRIVVCPEFTDSAWPGSRGYNLGNVFTGDDGAGSKNAEASWAFTVVDDLQARVRKGFGLRDRKFDMWGHSAGAQFVHRMILFRPATPVRLAVAANAGWYTAPDLDIDFPYGMRHPHLAFASKDILAFTSMPLVIMRGKTDTEVTSSLRQTPEANAQGKHRYARAGYMYDKGREADPNTSWALVDVDSVGHEHSEMAPPAQDLLEASSLAYR